MNYKTVIPVLVSCMIIYACPKDNDNPPGTGPDTNPPSMVIAEYQSAKMLNVIQLAIYTKNGVYTDTTLIRNYINRNFNSGKGGQYFHVGKSSAESTDIQRHLTILEGEKVRTIHCLVCLLQQTLQGLLFLWECRQ